MIFEDLLNTNDVLQVNEVKFTRREIDVISCIINGKSPKLIASFLSNNNKPIDLKTVNTHIGNIRRKIEATSRGGIIDFIEKSNQYKLIKCHYSNLLIQKEFTKYLTQISSISKSNDYTLNIIIYNHESDVKDKTYTIINNVLAKMKLHLEILGVTFKVEQESHFNFSNHSSTKTQEKYFVIHFLQDFSIQELIEGEFAVVSQKNHCNNLFIFYSNEEENIKTKISSQGLNFNYINIDTTSNYYTFFFDLLKQLFNFIEKDIQEIEEKFLKREEIISYNDAGINSNYTEKIISDDQQNKSSTILEILYCYYLKHKNFKISLIIISITIFGTLLFKSSTITVNKVIAQNLESSNLLWDFYEDLSNNNLSKESAEKNFSLIKKFDHIIQQIASGAFFHTININLLQSKELINCMYNLNAVASYALFVEYNHEKSEKILLFSKQLAESYLAKRSIAPIQFDKLSNSEIYTELSIIKDLPEIYTIMIYFLGRTYAVAHKSIESEKYFGIAEFLGSKFGLYEKILSQRNKLLLRTHKIEELIKQNNILQAKIEILDVIGFYQKIIEDSGEYILNYKPDNFKPETITPKNDTLNNIDCSKRILKLYAKLFTITESQQEQIIYLNSLQNFFVNNKSGSQINIFEVLSKTREKFTRISAEFYNNLGFLLLKLYDKNIDSTGALSKISKTLNCGIKSTDRELEIVYKIFELAKQLSRSSEFTKADAYEGLAECSLRMLNAQNITASEKEALSTNIVKFKKESQEINETLKYNPNK